MLLFSCEDFLHHVPKDKLTTYSALTSYDGIKAYAWQFYSAFLAYDQIGQAYGYRNEFDADLMQASRKNSESLWIYQKVEIPTNTVEYTKPFERIRACNVLIDNLNESGLSEKDIKHWKSVAYFFKAYNYMDLMNKYGDITWLDKTVKDGDIDILFGPRTPRDEVAANILDMLLYAEANIKPSGDGINTVNIDVVRALISRFGLREGTWRKYHGLDDADIYLNACVNASEPLLTAYPEIMEDYSDVFCSEDLAGKPGIILYKQYVSNQVNHQLSYIAGSSYGYLDLTRKAIDMYLMTDGQTRYTSPLFEGEYKYQEFRNRDIRLYCTTPPPYRVIGPGVATTYTHTGNPEDREFYDLINGMALNGGMKNLPQRAWCAYVVDKVPNFSDNNGGKTWSITLTGYQLWKFQTRINENNLKDNINDCPIFRIEEVMLNYAEAKHELGEFNQFICDNTINKLRNRGGVAPLNISNITDDPTRDISVNPLMWEIRRERAVELMAEGFRFDDLRRWKKMDYATERKLGKWIIAADERNRVPVLNGAASGYVSYEGIPPTPFPDYMYLYPIPSNQIILTNGVVEQNQGWSQ